MRYSSLWLGLIGVAAVACNDTSAPSIAAPQNLIYMLEASGDPQAPAGVLLTWDQVTDPDLDLYRVYSSVDGTNFDLRASTTSISFHDVGQPDLSYFVTAVAQNGDESDGSNEVTIDERLRLESPSSIVGTSLDQAVHLAWSDNAFLAEPAGFRRYRVYSTSYSLDDGLCGESWAVEGTTVSPEFLVGALTNGAPMCFGVSAESIEGWESLWSPLWADTPRPDARNVVVFRQGADITVSGFSFYMDTNGDGQVNANELGLVLRGDRTDIDFRVIDIAGVLYLEPVRAGTGVVSYGTVPVEDLTSIDIAPDTTFDASAIEASPGFGYVFEMDGGDGFARYGAVRVTHVGTDYLILDWSYQTDPGNPELQYHGGLPVGEGGGLVIRGVH